MNRTRCLFALALASSSLAFACGSSDSSSGSGDDSTNGSTVTASQLDEANGGIKAGNEEIAFGDTNISSLPDVSSQYLDTLDTSSTSTGSTTSDDAGAASGDDAGTSTPVAGGTAYHLALFWGHLPAAQDTTTNDSAPTAETWSGSVTVDSGLISVKRTISFDTNDSVSPRTNPKEVDFVSHTLPFVDGLFLRVVIPSGGSTMLHVNTASLTQDIDLSTLPAKEGGVTRLTSNPDEGLGWIGYQDVAGCSKGLVMGRWIKDAANLGELRGRVLSGDGDEDGFVRGLWGHAPKRNADVYIAKIIGPAGEDRGVTAGTYGDGVYSGSWEAATALSIAVGTTSGVYSDGYDKGDGRGVWMGRWSETKCAE